MATLDLQRAPEALRALLATDRKQVDQALSELFSVTPQEEELGRFFEAMKYAVLGGGKRLRPCLVLMACRACGGQPSDCMPAALAVELLHAYTLVHDDLPALDDDDMRRGRASVHRQFDEATAVLVGDALLTLSFRCLSELRHGAAEAVRLLATRGGHAELIAGQVLDVKLGHAPPSFEDLETIHKRKTGALFSASCELGALAAKAGKAQQVALRDYGMAIGVAFQHADDLDDGEFVMHREQAAAARTQLCSEAHKRLAPFPGAADPLRQLADWIGG